MKRKSAERKRSGGRIGIRVLLVGSNANNGALGGLSAANANNVFSNANANIGARLNFIS